MKHGVIDMEVSNMMSYLVSIFSLSSWISGIAAKVSCHEAALRLIISVLLGYPICLIYNLFFSKQPPIVKHIYNFLSGLFLCYFNYGINTFHSLVTCLFVYSVLTLLGGTRISVAINLTFCMSYLLYGYYLTQTGLEYSFTWTIPQCVLTLRLIALTFDLYDGQCNRQIGLNKKKKNNDGTISNTSSNTPTSSSKSPSSSSTSSKLVNEDTAVDHIPNLYELLSFSYFPGSILVGPLVSYKTYMQYISSQENFLPRSWLPALCRLSLGLVYLAFYQVGSLWWPHTYLTSTEFQNLNSFWWKATVIAIICKISSCKYVSGWLIAEGVCMLSGVSYDKKSNSFYGCSNVYVTTYETTPTFGGLIRSFNLTTNEFAAKYIFKRLKFLGVRLISHFITLLFLAVWHGWLSGYYITFGMEFLIMKMEWEVLSLVNSLRRKVKIIDNILSAFYVRWPLIILFRIYLLYMFGYCLVPFTLLSYAKWFPVLKQVYFCGHIIYGSWLLVSFFIP